MISDADVLHEEILNTRYDQHEVPAPPSNNVPSSFTTAAESRVGEHGSASDASASEVSNDFQLVPVKLSRFTRLSTRPWVHRPYVCSFASPAGGVSLNLGFPLRIYTMPPTGRTRRSTPTAVPHTAQTLGPQTGALVLYRPVPSRPLQLDVTQAVENLSEGPEVMQPQSFYEAADEVRDRKDSLPSSTNKHSGALTPESSEPKQLSSDTSTTFTTAPEDRHKVLCIEAAHQEEIANLERLRQEDQAIFTQNIQKEKAKTDRANVRAKNAMKRLKASRAAHANLEQMGRPWVQGLESSNTRLETKLAETKALLNDVWAVGQRLYQEHLQQQGVMQEQHVFYQERMNTSCDRIAREEVQPRINRIEQLEQQVAGLQQEVEQYGQAYLDEVLPRLNRLKQLEPQVAGLQHQMEQYEQACQAADAHANDLHDRLERQKLLNRALHEDKAAQYVEQPDGRECFHLLRPDELADAQQALLTSQDMHRKEIENNVNLSKDIDAKYQQIAVLTAKCERLRSKALALRSCKTLSNDVKKAYEGFFLSFALEDASGDSPELQEMALKAIATEQALKNHALKVSIENEDRKDTIIAMERVYARVLAKKANENAALLQKTVDVEATTSNNENKVDDLTQELEWTQEQLEFCTKEVQKYRAQFEERAYGDDHNVLLKLQKNELIQANKIIDMQAEELIDSQMSIEQMRWDANQQALNNERLQPARNWRKRALQFDAIIHAMKSRFADELRAQPLDIKYEAIVVPDEEDFEKDALEFDQEEWLNMRFGSKAQDSVEPLTDLNNTAHAELRAAVGLECMKRLEDGPIQTESDDTEGGEVREGRSTTPVEAAPGDDSFDIDRDAF